MQLREFQEIVGQEIKQREEEHCDVSALREEYKIIVSSESQDKWEKLEELLDKVDSLVSPYETKEPSDLLGIKSLRPEGPRSVKKIFSYAELYDRIYGAWLGRCAGCQLGKPVEGMSKEQAKLAAELSTGFPLANYYGAIVNPPEIISGRNWSPNNTSLIDRMSFMARDDDTDYTIVGLRLLERYGLEFTTEHVAAYWLSQFPYHQVYTAERIAYRNLVNGLKPPETATYLNPAREWIGAQIRADAFGYVCPGLPEKAAELAFKDASLSHTKNGIYGEMMVSAMIAAAFITDDIDEIIKIGLSEIPSECRLAEAIRATVERTKSDNDWEKTADWVADEYGHYQGCHTITNAAIVVMGLIAGQMDFGKTIGISVMAGFDTDCNGATAGSIIGTILGAKAIPEKWILPLNDTIYSSINEVSRAKISDLAERTVVIASKVLNTQSA
ncbi:MAG: ADP-ribosylglycohydrolase family protein [bacterium]